MNQQKMLKRSYNGGWEKVITSDEAWFYLRVCRGKRELQYISREQKRCDAVAFESLAHPQGINGVGWFISKWADEAYY